MRKQYERTLTRIGQMKPHAAVYDTSMPENVFDPTGGRWVVVCEEHATLVNVDRLRDALDVASDLPLFCEEHK